MTTTHSALFNLSVYAIINIINVCNVNGTIEGIDIHENIVKRAIYIAIITISLITLFFIYYNYTNI